MSLPGFLKASVLGDDARYELSESPVRDGEDLEVLGKDGQWVRGAFRASHEGSIWPVLEVRAPLESIDVEGATAEVDDGSTTVIYLHPRAVLRRPGPG